MFAIGASLREARELRGLSPEDVQKSLRIRGRYLTALEDEHWELLPGDAYTKGFLRTYAEFLGLNGTLYIDEYKERIAPPDEEPLVPDSLAPRRARSGLLTRMIVGVSVALARRLRGGRLAAGLVRSTPCRHRERGAPEGRRAARAPPRPRPRGPAAVATGAVDAPGRPRPRDERAAPGSPSASAARPAGRSSAASSTRGSGSGTRSGRSGCASAGRAPSSSRSAAAWSTACRARRRTCC